MSDCFTIENVWLFKKIPADIIIIVKCNGTANIQELKTYRFWLFVEV